MPLRLAKLRPDTLDALDALAREPQRSRPDVAHALARLATGEDKATIEWLLVAELAKIKPLQALRGTGRRARRAAKIEAAEVKAK